VLVAQGKVKFFAQKKKPLSAACVHVFMHSIVLSYDRFSAPYKVSSLWVVI